MHVSIGDSNEMEKGKQNKQEKEKEQKEREKRKNNHQVATMVWLASSKFGWGWRIATPLCIQLAYGIQYTITRAHPRHNASSPHNPRSLSLSVLGLDEIGHGLGLAVEVMGTVGIGVGVMVLAVAVAVRILGRAHVLHLVRGATLGAALDRAVTRDGQPDDNVGVGGATGAADVLLVAK